MDFGSKSKKQRLFLPLEYEKYIEVRTEVEENTLTEEWLGM